MLPDRATGDEATRRGGLIVPRAFLSPEQITSVFKDMFLPPPPFLTSVILVQVTRGAAWTGRSPGAFAVKAPAVGVVLGSAMGRGLRPRRWGCAGWSVRGNVPSL